MEDYDSQQGSGTKEVTLARTQVGYCKVTFLQEMAGFYQAGYLSHADQIIPE